MKKQQVKPIRGFRDFVPEDWKTQQYMFNVWRDVCLKYGYEEYSGPILERIEIYNKSGDDVGTAGKELYTFADSKGRFLAIRPEMTPTLGRMIAGYGTNYPKPIRWFSIAQFFRAEKPQKGRGREFFQLNADIFGSMDMTAEFEVVNLGIDIMSKFGATEKMFVDRKSTRLNSSHIPLSRMPSSA